MVSGFSFSIQKVPRFPGDSILSVNVQIQLCTEPGKYLNTCHAVAMFVQGRSIDSNAHFSGNDAHDPSAYTAFGRKTYLKGKLTGSVIHAAGSKGCIDISGNAFGNICIPEAGLKPWCAKILAIRARSRQSTRIEQALK